MGREQAGEATVKLPGAFQCRGLYWTPTGTRTDARSGGGMNECLASASLEVGRTPGVESG